MLWALRPDLAKEVFGVPTVDEDEGVEYGPEGLSDIDKWLSMQVGELDQPRKMYLDWQ